MRLICLLSILLLCGCAVPAGSMLIHLRSGTQLNSTASGLATSVLVVFYELTANSSIGGCSLYDLQQSDACLGKSLLYKHKIILFPNQNKDLLLRLHKHSNWLAAAVLFQSKHVTEWPMLIRLRPWMHWLAVSSTLHVGRSSFSFVIKREVL